MIENGLIKSVQGLTSPLSLLEAKRHLRIIGVDSDDAYIQDCIDSAEAILEEQTMLALRQSQYVSTFPSFMTTLRNMQNLYLYRNPVVNIISFTMLDIDNIPRTVTNYQLRTSLYPATLAPLAGQFWPLSKYRTMEAIRVEYTAGFASFALPPKLKLAMRYLVAHLYEMREPIIAQSGVLPYEIPKSITALINSLKYGGFM